MTWIYLFVAGIFEIGFALGLKYSEGFTRLWPTLGMVAAGALSLYLLSTSKKSLPVGGSLRQGPRLQWRRGELRDGCAGRRGSGGTHVLRLARRLPGVGRAPVDRLGKVLHRHRSLHDGLAHLAREAQAKIARSGEDGTPEVSWGPEVLLRR